MPANTEIIPLKAIYTGSDVTALGELATGDKLSPTYIDLSNYPTQEQASADAVAVAIALG
jgi:hypothetical protein